MKEYNTEMKANRMGKGAKGKSQEPVACANRGQKVSPAEFGDAESFLKSGGVDGAMQDIGNKGSIPKGDKSPGVPKLKKGSSGPKGPGVK